MLYPSQNHLNSLGHQSRKISVFGHTSSLINGEVLRGEGGGVKRPPLRYSTLIFSAL